MKTLFQSVFVLEGIYNLYNNNNNNNNKVCVVVRKRKGQIYKKEAPISPAGPEHSKTSRNDKLKKLTSDAILQQEARSFSDGSSFLFLFKRI